MKFVKPLNLYENMLKKSLKMKPGRCCSWLAMYVGENGVAFASSSSENNFTLAGPASEKISNKIIMSSFGSDGQAWAEGNPNQVCGIVVNNMMRTSGFLLDQGWPLFVSEFGVDLRGGNVIDNRNSSFLQRLPALQSPFRGPGIEETNLHKLIFHPLTGFCVLRKSIFDPLRLGLCSESEAWSYTAQKTGSVSDYEAVKILGQERTFE
ncbi:hypothetical protein EZV62_007378 [Acer yangbiense]|uniref:Uncharacterized protein n=1 Tax=Acer yangbiense TaxID=1000413 RepID=A0A5C7I931_9ROSI|nr:hypothetical protein EZV62_007378 [Acer yangbiense]